MSISGTFSPTTPVNTNSSVHSTSSGSFQISIAGPFQGRIAIQRSFNNTTWNTVDEINGPIELNASEPIGPTTYYRLQNLGIITGTASYELR